MDTVMQGNKLIASFMDFEFVTVGYFGCEDQTEWQVKNQEWCERVGLDSVGDYIVNTSTDLWFEVDEIKYHTSFDWIMPVWYKVRDLKFTDVKTQLEHSSIKVSIDYRICYGTIDELFVEIFTAIQWYNTTSQH